MAVANTAELAIHACVPLSAVVGLDRESVGAKAANLAALISAGFPVPDGFVLTTAAFEQFLAVNRLSSNADPAAIAAAPMPPDLAEALQAAATVLGDGPLAVRSSAVAEDLAGASFAGQYETVLDVRGPAALEVAVRQCWASAFAPRVAAYRSRHHPETPGAPGHGMGVLVQRLVLAEAAGVAFTANPVTGDRAETIVSAVRGLGEALVSGVSGADEWVVRQDESGRLRASRSTSGRQAEPALRVEQAEEVGRLARRIAAHFERPQDVEWAISAGQLFVLQARPMTALPEPVSWQVPYAGGWMRNFRLGEWLPEPVTPLFESWLLARMEGRFILEQERDCGFLTPPPQHVVVNGWYFHSPLGSGGSRLLLRGMLRRPRFSLASMLIQSRPDLTDRFFVADLRDTWRDELLPRYRRIVETWQSGVEEARADELIRLVDDVADIAGAYMWSITMVGGFAWKVEGTLAKFYRKHLRERVGRSHQELLCGLPTPSPAPPEHAVQSIDWFHPTLGELGVRVDGRERLQAARAKLEAVRRTTEASCRAALAGSPALLRRFERVLDVAQRYAIVREEQVASFTLGWPLLRRAVLRLGAELHRRGVIERDEDVFFLSRMELEGAVHGGATAPDLRAAIAGRQQAWERQRRLSPPLLIGALPTFMAKLVDDSVEAMRLPGTASVEAIRGMPASPGRATGPARVIRGPEDVDRFRPGEVVVAQVTIPAWTPLFLDAAAVVTDGGTVAAHASLVAREYGIPAVVATGNATARLHDGQIVTVDGSTGLVEVRS